MYETKRHGRFVCLVCAAWLTIGCARLDGPSGAGPPTVLYVLNGGDHTVWQIDTGSGHRLGAPVYTGGSPRTLVPGRGGHFVVITDGRPDGSRVKSFVRSDNALIERRVVLDPDAEPVLASGDGVSAAVLYRQRQGPDPASALGPCRLAVIDLATGRAASPTTVCAGGEAALSLAVEHRGGRSVVYVGIWSFPQSGDSRRDSGRGAILAIDGESGRRLGGVALAGAPRSMVVGPAPGIGERRLYGVVQTPGPDGTGGEQDGDRSDPAYTSGHHWQLIRFEPSTLTAESAQSLSEPPLWLSIAENGNSAYALSARGSPGVGSVVLHIDLVGGSQKRLATLPGIGLGLAVSGGHLYVASPETNSVWRLDGRTDLPRAIRVGRGPVGVATIGW